MILPFPTLDCSLETKRLETKSPVGVFDVASWITARSALSTASCAICTAVCLGRLLLLLGDLAHLAGGIHNSSPSAESDRHVRKNTVSSIENYNGTLRTWSPRCPNKCLVIASSSAHNSESCCAASRNEVRRSRFSSSENGVECHLCKLHNLAGLSQGASGAGGFH